MVDRERMPLLEVTTNGRMYRVRFPTRLQKFRTRNRIKFSIHRATEAFNFSHINHNNMSTPKNPFQNPFLKGEDLMPPQFPAGQETGVSIVVPAGHKAILIRKEFNPEIVAKISELEAELKTLGGVSTQDDVERINASLKKAKTLIKTIGAERLLIASELKTEQDALITMERTAYAELQKMVGTYDKAIVDYQTAKLKKDEEERIRIQKQKDEELKKITDNNNRIARIKSTILEFERNVLNAIHTSTILDVDSKIAHLKNVKLTAATYEEFLPEAEIMYQNVTTKFQERKTELMRLAELEKKNKEAADKMREEQAQKAAIEKEQQEQKAEIQQQELSETLESDVANAQMAAELRGSMITKSKNVMTRYVFDETQVDLKLLPDEYKTYDKAKIQEAINAGLRECPGLVIEPKISNVSR